MKYFEELQILQHFSSLVKVIRSITILEVL